MQIKKDFCCHHLPVWTNSAVFYFRLWLICVPSLMSPDTTTQLANIKSRRYIYIYSRLPCSSENDIVRYLNLYTCQIISYYLTFIMRRRTCRHSAVTPPPPPIIHTQQAPASNNLGFYSSRRESCIELLTRFLFS